MTAGRKTATKKSEPDPDYRFSGCGMKRAVNHIRFVGIGHAGAGAPASSCAAQPLPQGTQESIA